MSRNFGMKMLTMTNLSTECLIQLTKLGYDATPFNQILKQNAKREMRLRLGKVTVADVLAAQPVTTNLLKFMRASIKMIGVSNLQSFIASMTQKLTLSDISDESKNYLDKAGQIKEMTRKVSAEVDLVHQQTQNQRYGSSHIGATAKDISNVVTDAAS